MKQFKKEELTQEQLNAGNHYRIIWWLTGDITIEERDNYAFSQGATSVIDYTDVFDITKLSDSHVLYRGEYLDWMFFRLGTSVYKTFLDEKSGYIIPTPHLLQERIITFWCHHDEWDTEGLPRVKKIEAGYKYHSTKK